jgi:hypothetical protein
MQVYKHTTFTLIINEVQRFCNISLLWPSSSATILVLTDKTTKLQNINITAGCMVIIMFLPDELGR